MGHAHIRGPHLARNVKVLQSTQLAKKRAE